MRAVTHNVQNNKYLFSLIKKKKKKAGGPGRRISSPQALTCCMAAAAVVEKLEAWDGCALHRLLGDDE